MDFGHKPRGRSVASSTSFFCWVSSTKFLFGQPFHPWRVNVVEAGTHTPQPQGIAATGARHRATHEAESFGKSVNRKLIRQAYFKSEETIGKLTLHSCGQSCQLGGRRFLMIVALVEVCVNCNVSTGGSWETKRVVLSAGSPRMSPTSTFFEIKYKAARFYLQICTWQKNSQSQGFS